MVLGSLLWVILLEQGEWTRRLPEGPSNLSHSVIWCVGIHQKVLNPMCLNRCVHLGTRVQSLPCITTAAVQMLP